MQITQSTLDFIARIYGTVLDPGRWREVLDETVEQLGATAGSLVISDSSLPEIRLQHASSFYPPGFLEEYHDRFAELERDAFERMAAFPAHRWVTDEEGFGCPVSDIPTTKWIKERFGLYRRSATRLNDEAAWLDFLSLQFSADRGNMTPEEIRHSQVLLPHLARAVEVSRPFVVLKARFNAVLKVLDRFHVGVAILSEHGSVVLTNRALEQVLDKQDGLTINGRGRLVACSEPDNTALIRAIARAIATSKADSQDSGQLLTVTRKTVSEHFLLEVTPLHNHAFGLDSLFRGALVLVIDPDYREVISTAGLQALYGLSKAESAVFELLLDGHSGREMADIRGVSPETVRSQIKSVYAKTRSHNRAELVRLALAVNLPIDRIEE